MGFLKNVFFSFFGVEFFFVKIYGIACLGLDLLIFKGVNSIFVILSLRDRELRLLGALLFLNFAVGLDLSFFEFYPIMFLVAAFLVDKVLSLNFASLLR